MSEYLYDIVRLSQNATEVNEADAFDYKSVEVYAGDEYEPEKSSNVTELATTDKAEDRRTLSVKTDWWEKGMADNIKESLSGFQYQPYKASGVELTPDVEIGDTVDVNGLHSTICSVKTSYGGMSKSDIAAPIDEQIENEYSTDKSKDREILRQLNNLESKFNIKVDQISAEVSQSGLPAKGGAAKSCSWVLTKDQWVVKYNGAEKFRVDGTGASVTGKITATTGTIGGFDIKASSLTTKGKTWQTIADATKKDGSPKNDGLYIGSNGIMISNVFRVGTGGGVYIKGKVECTSLVVDGKTITPKDFKTGINGGNSYAGSGLAKGVGSGSGQIDLLRVKTLKLNGDSVFTHWIKVDGKSIQVWCAQV